MKDDLLYNDAINAISKLFSNTQHDQSWTRTQLRSLRDEIDTMIDSLDDETDDGRS